MERLPGEEAVRLVPLVLEHFGHWGQQAEKYLHQLSLRSTDECGNSNSSQFKTYWRERLSVQLQRCNSRVIYIVLARAGIWEVLRVEFAGR